MSEQPEAMRLANLLETDGWPDAAAELRGMHERIQILYEQLGEAEKQLDQQYKLGMEAEREACAKVCDDWLSGRDDVCEIAKSIRARGNHAD
jgi:hypothetical protein